MVTDFAVDFILKIVTLLAQKGGTGKTTLAIHLAVLATARKKKVTIADI